jgi:hypothetical protein
VHKAAQSAFALLATLSLASIPLEGCTGTSGEENPAVTTTGAGAGSTNTGAAAGMGGDASGGNPSVGGASVGGSGVGAGVPPPPTEKVYCGGNKLYECGDLIDNDGDGLIDYQDPDCLGPCDNNESGYFPALPGLPGQKCDLDCFWDTGQGHEENCYWHHECDPHANDQLPQYNGIEANPQSSCTFSGTEAEQWAHTPKNSKGKSCDEMYNDQEQQCLDECHPVTPNGCDCFGCCELGGTYVWIGSLDADGKTGTCDVGDVGQPNFFEECHPCVPVPGCNNPCEHCELCIGKTELPADCYPPGQGGGGSGGSPQECPVGQQACGLPNQPPCPSGHYCITGCCVAIPQ